MTAETLWWVIDFGQIRVYLEAVSFKINNEIWWYNPEGKVIGIPLSMTNKVINIL